MGLWQAQAGRHALHCGVAFVINPKAERALQENRLGFVWGFGSFLALQKQNIMLCHEVRTLKRGLELRKEYKIAKIKDLQVAAGHTRTPEEQAEHDVFNEFSTKGSFRAHPLQRSGFARSFDAMMCSTKTFSMKPSSHRRQV